MKKETKLQKSLFREEVFSKHAQRYGQTLKNTKASQKKVLCLLLVLLVLLGVFIGFFVGSTGSTDSHANLVRNLDNWNNN